MSISYEQIQAFVYREARLLDDRQWEEWLECYHKDVVFWMPCWDDDDTLVKDPMSEVSLVYYPSREGLEDRVYRIRTERSGASTPEPRTTHQVTNLEVLERDADSIKIRFNWHTLSHRYKQTDSYFGASFYTLDITGGQPLIKEKVVQLNNDYIHQVIDVYHI